MSPLTPLFQRAAQLAAIFTAIIGATAAFGWILDVPLMRSFVPGRSEMKFNTALALIAGGIGLVLVAGGTASWRKRAGQGFGLFLVLLGGATLAEYLLSISFGIDELFFTDQPNAIGTTSPGRMSPQTTITFLCIGAALLCFDRETRRGQRPAQWLALAAAMFPLQLLIHHVYGGQMILGLGPAQYSLMAVPTVLALLSLSVGTLLARPNMGWMTFATSRTFAGRSLRRMLLLGLILPSAIGAVILFALDGQHNEPSFAISAFAMFTTLAFCALMAQHTRQLHAAEIERTRAEAEREKALADLKRAHDLLNDHAGQLESVVRQRTAALSEANEQLETFAFSIAHDLRAPIRAQNGFARILETDFAEKLGADGQHAVRRIREGAERLSMMVEDLLSYARVGRGEWRIEAVPVGRLLDTARDDALPQVLAKGGTLDVAASLAVVEAHGTTLSLCVANLLSNAIKFTRPGIPPRIQMWTESFDGVVRIFVRDNGIGISKDQQEKIFGVFQRLHNPSEFPGNGIGLALVRRGIERMGGKVTIESSPGEGSTFCIELRAAGLENRPDAAVMELQESR